MTMEDGFEDESCSVEVGLKEWESIGAADVEGMGVRAVGV